jgi:hypothetical protein
MRKQKRRLIRIAGLATIALLIIVTVAAANYMYLERQAARIPAPIRQDLTFSPLVVTLDNRDYKATSYKLSQVEGGIQLLSFVVHFENKAVTVSEYAQPPEFVEITEYKERFLNNIIKQYATVQTANGTIYLGKQTKQGNKQLGIMLERGLVILFNPGAELTQAEWRRFGEQFDIQKISS